MGYVHSPVLLEETISYLVGEQDDMFLDCTVGEGGHTEAILDRFKKIKVIGLDRDEKILQVARLRMERFGDRFIGINTNFKNVQPVLDMLDGRLFDGALIDLGISVYHYKISGRGFTFSGKEKLDMRLDGESISVFDIINNYSQNELSEIFFKYGEERFSREIAKRIVEDRGRKTIEYADELAELIRNAIPPKFRSMKIHPATKIFQALRIVANNEFENIEKGIPAILSLLKPKGKLGVISFHSLEDRIVKHLFQYMDKDCICPPKFPQCVCNKVKEINILSKAIGPTEEEARSNPPSRSAKLRVVEKV
jgi:16S rRNA (cytosine1402-N4)-methyltransferase